MEKKNCMVDFEGVFNDDGIATLHKVQSDRHLTQLSFPFQKYFALVVPPG
jgi:hypothetical protein